jgi:hypothetical protein
MAKWPPHFDVRGTKTEPTWVEAIRLMRKGDVFVLEGGGLADAEQTVAAIAVDPVGTLRWLACPPLMACTNEPPPAGFLASAVLLGALRRGALAGEVVVFPFDERRIFCIAAEKLGYNNPIMDPCFDAGTGAVLAQRMRVDGSVSGPSMDPGSIRYVNPPGPLPEEMRAYE